MEKEFLFVYNTAEIFDEVFFCWRWMGSCLVGWLVDCLVLFNLFICLVDCSLYIFLSCVGSVNICSHFVGCVITVIVSRSIRLSVIRV